MGLGLGTSRARVVFASFARSLSHIFLARASFL